MGRRRWGAGPWDSLAETADQELRLSPVSFQRHADVLCWRRVHEYPGREQQSYNQDNETTWLNWDLLQKNQDIVRFFTLRVAFRKTHPFLGRSRFWREDIHWYGVGTEVDRSLWSHSLAFCLHGSSQQDTDLYVMVNAYTEDLHSIIQEGRASDWLRVVDTSFLPPDDFAETGLEIRLQNLDYQVTARSIVVLIRR